MPETDFKASGVVDVAYIEKMCYEFSKLLYDVSQEHNHICEQWAQKCATLEARCNEYEEQLLRPQEAAVPVSLWTKLKIRLRRAAAAVQRRVKQLLSGIAVGIFGWGRRVVTGLGIKDRLKSTRLFQDLYRKGTIDKLRK